jgi:hypothetical protein
MEGIVPVAMEFVAANINGRDLAIRDFDTGGVDVRVEFGMHGEACPGCCGSDEIHYDFMAYERLATPVLADEREQPMLNLVPLAGSGRQMTDSNPQSGFIGKFLQFDFPKTYAGSVAAA